MSNKHLRHALEQAEDDVTQLREEKGSYLFLIEKLREENEMLKKNIEVRADIMLRDMETIKQIREENERLVEEVQYWKSFCVDTPDNRAYQERLEIWNRRQRKQMEDEG